MEIFIPTQIKYIQKCKIHCSVAANQIYGQKTTYQTYTDEIFRYYENKIKKYRVLTHTHIHTLAHSVHMNYREHC